MKKHAMERHITRRPPGVLARAILAGVTGGTGGTIIVQNVVAAPRDFGDPPPTRIRETLVGD